MSQQEESAAWKIVGVGRRLSTSVPALSESYQDDSALNAAAAAAAATASAAARGEQNADDQSNPDDLVLSRQRAFRTRAASTPNPLMAADASAPQITHSGRANGTGSNGNNATSAGSYPPGLVPGEGDATSTATTAGNSGGGNWNGPGMAWGASQSSIWKGGNTNGNGTTSLSAGSTPAETTASKAQYFPPTGVPATSAAFPARQFRSFSFSLGSMRGLESYHEEEESFDRDRVITLPLRGGDDPEGLANDEDDTYEDHLNLPKMRSRSKSSSEIYGLLAGQEARYSYPPVEDPASPVSPTADYGDVNSIWAATQGTAAGRAHDAATAMMHRRPSAQPGAVHWGGAAQQEGIPTAEQIDRYRQQRRFSHAPGLYNDYSAQQMLPRNMDHPDPSAAYDLARRRHSLAGPLYGSSAPDFMTAGMDALRLDDPSSETPFLDEIDDYFENTKRRTKAWVEAGKNLQAQSYTHQWPLYVVEFKAGRTDFFHVVPDMTGPPIKKGDLVIVEADRGKDLGKVIQDNIQTLQQVQLYQQQHSDTLVDSHNVNKEVHPKRIYRAAAPAEVTMLVSKSQDEAKAMGVCQTKIRQKKMPMEIVDAEYQWDRRKLTFYFVADRRIDFRELVRELFKIYKTRIWMCVSSPGGGGAPQRAF
ncbi:hypothetical protein HKX48_000491 [Thoreauomyces humboldtii]|nr:hypothetical protein HKX48_000491 [Thoreauomyces humboldtii]